MGHFWRGLGAGHNTERNQSEGPLRLTLTILHRLFLAQCGKRKYLPGIPNTGTLHPHHFFAGGSYSAEDTRQHSLVFPPAPRTLDRTVLRCVQRQCLEADGRLAGHPASHHGNRAGP